MAIARFLRTLLPRLAAGGALLLACARVVRRWAVSQKRQVPSPLEPPILPVPSPRGRPLVEEMRSAGGLDAASEPRAYRLIDLSEGYTRTKVIAEVSPKFARRPFPPAEAEIRTEWARRCSLNRALFNSLKFRLHGIERVGASATPRGRSPAVPLSPLSEARGVTQNVVTALRLNLWLTEYRVYVGGDLGPRGKELAHRGTDAFGDAGAHLSKKLGVSSLVRTTDGCILALRRSQLVAVDEGLLDCPGGHPEPSRALGVAARADTKSSGKSVLLSAAEARMAAAARTRVLIDEIFDSSMNEVRDECNVPLSSLSEPILLGMVRQAPPRSSVSLAFFMNVRLTAKEVQERYAKGAAEGFESTELHAISARDLVQSAGQGEGAMPGPLTTCLDGALELLRRHLAGSEAGAGAPAE